jgi:hypothetical protein
MGASFVAASEVSLSVDFHTVSHNNKTVKE